ncbi:Npun_R2821/Npun_R2822 family protein [Leptolyngbya sp. AN03gr2]|uniref:Npun_R2821/Npun_R2822 family protein n=1 Tax=unclassified Leptolyngbya TaxID=2650499 RepID=UPI003D324424
MTNGIYTFANDVVYDQLVALLNSIEANVDPAIPVCIIPYDDQLDRVRSEIEKRPNVTLFENAESIQYWENFATRAWGSHRKAQRIWKERGWSGTYRLERHRKLCCLDGEFDQFIYFDADTLALSSLDRIFERLNQFDWVTYDFQHRSDFNYIMDCSEPKLFDLFSPDYLASHLFCSGWFASKKGVLDRQQLNELLTKLESGESEVMAWRDSDQAVLNYLVLRSGLSYCNLAFEPDATGCHWMSPFREENHLLYDQDQLVTYLHYMSVASSQFRQLCAGIDVELPYRDLFLHYRYLKSPHDRPTEFKVPDRISQARSMMTQFRKRKMNNLNHRLRKLKHQIKLCQQKPTIE